MEITMMYKGTELTFMSIQKALVFFDKTNGCKIKELYLKRLDGGLNERKYLLKKGIYVGNGSNLKTNGYKVFEDYDTIYELKKAEELSIAYEKAIA